MSTIRPGKSIRDKNKNVSTYLLMFYIERKESRRAHYFTMISTNFVRRWLSKSTIRYKKRTRRIDEVCRIYD